MTTGRSAPCSTRRSPGYGYDVRTTGNAATLWRWVAEGEGDLVITDVVMPDENGLDLIPRIRKIRPELRIIVMSAQNTLMTAVKATERGAFEYLPKPFDLRELVNVVQRALTLPALARAQVEEVTAQEQLPLIGRSPAMQEIYRVLARLMGTDLTVMIIGESGTGKELVARALHDFGKRRSGPFVAVNMAAIPRELIESELFGHEKGAFTGAAAAPIGRFEQAQGGTLFLDEIGDMPIEAQTRLLRVLQSGEYTTVGGRTPIRADVRIVAATHRDLRQLIRQGLFREDLFYRLNVVPIRLPPLRERSEDIPALVRHFLSQAEAEGLPRQDARPGGDGAAQEPIAGRATSASWRTSSAASPRSMPRRSSASTSSRPSSPRRCRRASHRPCRRTRGWAPRSSGISRTITPRTRTRCRPPGSTTGCCARSSDR